MENKIDEKNLILETEDDQPKGVKHKKAKEKKQKGKMSGSIRILFITLAISFCFGILSELLMSVTQSVVGTIVSIVLLIFL